MAMNDCTQATGTDPAAGLHRPRSGAEARTDSALQHLRSLGEYMTDAVQRTILFWDVLRQRSEQHYEQRALDVPHVLSFDAELVLDARSFAKPVNYLLVRIKPPQGVVIDARKRPFVVVDPRAGHGPGIGGFKADSEIGVALRSVLASLHCGDGAESNGQEKRDAGNRP